MRFRIGIVGLIALGGAGAATESVAQTYPPLSRCRLSENGKSYLAPANYVHWALGEMPISSDVIDVNKDGNDTFAEKRAVFLDHENVLKRAQQNNDASPASKTRDVTNVTRAALNLQTFLEHAITRPDFPFRVVRLGRLSAGDKNSEQILRDVSYARLFHWYLGSESTPPTVAIECVGADRTAVAARQKEQEAKVGFGDRALAALKVRKSYDKLSLARGQTSATDAAVVSISRNLKKRESLFTLDGTLGISLQTLKITDWLSPIDDVIPFVEFHRRFQIGRNRRPDDINNVTAGFQANVLLNSPVFEPGLTLFGIRREDFGMSALVELTPTYTTDTQTGAKVGDLELTIKPAFDFGMRFLISPNWLPLSIGGTELGLYRVIPAMRLSAGKVFDNGGSQVIENKEEYLRLGGSINAAWRGVPGSLLERLELSIEYKYLRGFRSRPQEIRWLRTAAAYRVTDWASLNFQYVWGDEEKTFQRQNFWEFQIGILF